MAIFKGRPHFLHSKKNMSIRNLRLEDVHVFMRKDGNVTGAVITHKYAKRIAGLSAVFQLLIRRADRTAQETSERWVYLSTSIPIAVRWSLRKRIHG